MLPLLFFIHSASAVTYNLTFCGRYDVAYDDASGSFHDDYVTSSGTYPARGARITVTRNSDGAVMRDAYTSDSGSTPGCLTSTVALDSTQTYNLKIWSRASVSGNTVYVYNDDTSFGISGYGPSGYAATSSGTYTVTPPQDRIWNIANAAGHAIWRRNAGLTGKSFVLFDQRLSATTGTAYDRDHNWVYVSTGGAKTKYMIAHELGHVVSAMNNDTGTCATPSCADNHSYNATTGACYTTTTFAHEANSKEFASAAAWEGYADWYSVIAFNRTDEADCWWVYYKNVDWDLTGSLDPAPSEETEPLEVSCETYPSLAPHADSVGTYCGGGANRSTEYDWLRFLWDLDTSGISHTTLFDILDDADPDTWNASGNGADTKDSTPCSPAPSNPVGRFRCAAQTAGLLTTWDNWADYNGTNR